MRFLHDDARLRHRVCDRLVGQNVRAIDVKLVADDHILTQNGHILHPHLKEIQDRIKSRPNTRASSIRSSCHCAIQHVEVYKFNSELSWTDLFWTESQLKSLKKKAFLPFLDASLHQLQCSHSGSQYTLRLINTSLLCLKSFRSLRESKGHRFL